MPTRRFTLAVAAAALAIAGSAAFVGRGQPAARLTSAPPPPAADPVADSALAAAAARGRAILAATGDSLPAHVGNALRCTSCHLDDGTRPGAMPWTGVYARFPQYRGREGTVIRLEDRINACLERSLAGRALPHEHRAMRDMVAYMASLSRGVPVGGRVAGQGLGAVDRTIAGDAARGGARFAQACARCHGAAGEGGSAPPVAGPRAFTIGAGMARLRTAAAFIRHNMPHDRPGTLDDRDATDIAAWLVRQPRPDYAAKHADWPNGGAPPDAAYATRGATLPSRGSRP